MDFGAIVYSVISIIPKVTYVLATSFLGVLDLLQSLVRKFAGLDVYYVNHQNTTAGSSIEDYVGGISGDAQSGDIVYHFIRGILFGEYPMLTNVFISIIILGVILLFLTTLIAIIRQEYNYEKDNSKGKIIGATIKSAFMFGIIPIVVLFGVYLANIVLVAVDAASSPTGGAVSVWAGKTDQLEKYNLIYNSDGTGGETSAQDKTSYIGYNIFGNLGQTENHSLYGTTTATFSGSVFRASAYTANRVRLTLNKPIDFNGQKVGFYELLNAGQAGGGATNFGGLFTGTSEEQVANYIDIAFSDAVYVSNPETLSYDNDYVRGLSSETGNPFFLLQHEEKSFINRFDVELVWYYYDLWQYNFIIAFGAGIMLTTILVNICFGLGKRLIELLGLFIAVPALIGIMPLDGGNAFKSWRGMFIKKTLMAYGAIGGMNLFFIILPYLNTISFFNITLIDRLVNTIIMIIGILSVKGFIGLVSDFAGGENAEAEGGKVAKEVGSSLAKAGTLVAGAVAGPMLAGAKVGKILGKGAAKLGGSVGRHALGSKYGTRARTFLEKKKTRDSKADHLAEDTAAVDSTVYEQFDRYRRKILESGVSDPKNKDLYDSTISNLKKTNPELYKKKIDEKLRAEFSTIKSHTGSITGAGMTKIQDENGNITEVDLGDIITTGIINRQNELRTVSLDNVAAKSIFRQANVRNFGKFREATTKRGKVGGLGLGVAKTVWNWGKGSAIYSASELKSPATILSNSFEFSGALTGNDFSKGFTEGGGLKGIRETLFAVNKKVKQQQAEIEAMKSKMKQEAEIKEKLRREGYKV